MVGEGTLGHDGENGCSSCRRWWIVCKWFSTIRRLAEGRKVLVDTENLSRCTIHKQEINGDDCGRGRDNVWSCLCDDT